MYLYGIKLPFIVTAIVMLTNTDRALYKELIDLVQIYSFSCSEVPPGGQEVIKNEEEVLGSWYFCWWSNVRLFFSDLFTQ